MRVFVRVSMRTMRWSHALAGLALLASFARAQAQTVLAPATGPDDRNLEAAQRWIGRALIFRGFYGENDLKFDAKGKLETSATSVDWTLAGMDIEKATRVDGETIELDGVRSWTRYNPDAQAFERHPQKDLKIKVLVGTVRTASREAMLTGTDPFEETLGEIFSVGIDPALQRAMPEYWSHYFDPRAEWGKDPMAGITVYPSKPDPNAAPLKAGAMAPSAPPAGLVYPEVARRVPSGFTAEAEKDRLKGLSEVRLVVDAEGGIHHVRITKPLGDGLDARLAQGVKKWQFEPAHLDGKKVAAGIYVSENFVPAPPKSVPATPKNAPATPKK